MTENNQFDNELFKKRFAEIFKNGPYTKDEFKYGINKAIKESMDNPNKEIFDYRVTEMECTLLFDYIEEDTFEEFYWKLKNLCNDYNVHLSGVIRREDIMTCGGDEK